MSARDEALDLLEKMLPREHAKAYRKLFSKRFDAFAHELAEQQRALADANDELDHDHHVYGFSEAVRQAANLIDPHGSAGPVRPDEETTP